MKDISEEKITKEDEIPEEQMNKKKKRKRKKKKKKPKEMIGSIKINFSNNSEIILPIDLDDKDEKAIDDFSVKKRKLLKSWYNDEFPDRFFVEMFKKMGEKKTSENQQQSIESVYQNNLRAKAIKKVKKRRKKTQKNQTGENANSEAKVKIKNIRNAIALKEGEAKEKRNFCDLKFDKSFLVEQSTLRGLKIR